MKKIYISGKITDNANYKADFEAAGIEIFYERKKPAYNSEYRRAQYIKHREKILQKQKEYDDQHREEINRKARAR